MSGKDVQHHQKYGDCPKDFFTRGLGDYVALACRMTGIELLAKCWSKKTGKPCGCAKRQDKLNQLGM